MVPKHLIFLIKHPLSMDIPPIDTKFLRPATRGQFNKNREVFEKAYRQVLDSLKDLSGVVYVPVVYAFPFILVKEQRLDAERVLVLRFLSVTSVDSYDVDRLGIYISTYVSELDYEDMVACFATELAHFVYLKGEVKVDPRLLPAHLEDGDLDVHGKQGEDQAAQERALFNDPVSGWLENFNNKMMSGELISKVKDHANMMQFGNFLEVVLGEKYAELKAKQLEKLKDKIRQK